MFDKLLGEVRGIFNIITIMELIISVFYILVGLIFFTNTALSNLLVSIITGIILIVNGVASIYAYFKRGDIVLFNNDLVYGILLIIVGLIAMFLGNILTIMLGIYFLIGGIQKINYGIFLKKFNESSWLLTLVMGILFLAIGIITFFTNSDAAVKVTGICLLGFGLINFINIILLRRRSKYFIA